MTEVYEFECNELEEMLIVNYKEGFAYNMSYEDDVYSVAVKLNEQEAIIEGLKEKLCELGVSDVKINNKRIDTGLGEWLE